MTTANTHAPVPEIEPDLPVAQTPDSLYPSTVAAIQGWIDDLTEALDRANQRVADAEHDLAQAQALAARHAAAITEHVRALAVLEGSEA